MPAIISKPLTTLDQLGADLVGHLGGSWDQGRRQGMCRCPAHADRSPSLSVRIGERRLLFHCFAGCTNRAVIRELHRISPEALAHGAIIGASPPRPDNDRVRARISDLWAAGSAIQASPAELYLNHRAIAAASSAIRYHPRTPLGPKGAVQFRPAMLAAIHDGAAIVALQRTFLDIDQGRRARDLGNPRRMLGRPGRGCVRLAPAFETLGLAEGIESALSAMILLGLPVWATLGNERLARIDVPIFVRRLVLLADNDRAGRIAVEAALDAHAAPGRIIETLWPWHGLNDWNDVLRAEGKGVGDRVRHGA